MIFKRISRKVSKRISGDFFLRESLVEMRWLSESRVLMIKWGRVGK